MATVKEGASTNAWIVTKDGVLVTRPAEQRDSARHHAHDAVGSRQASLGCKIEERDFTVDEAKQAREAFITSATTVVTPVVAIDGSPVANGHPGSVALSLRARLF